MKKEQKSSTQTLHFLKWIRKYPGWWYLICTPNDEHMTLDMMRHLLQKLSHEGFYELIFVLLMVHREHPTLSRLSDYLLLDSLIARWDGERDAVIEEIQQFVQ